MFDSIWLRPGWEIFAFFAFGTALAATVCARASLRLGGDFPRRRPILFGAEVGAALGLAICVYLWASTNSRFDEIDGAALSVCEKARLVGFPISALLTRLTVTGCAFVYFAAFVVQTTLLGAVWGATGLRRCIAWLDNRNEKENDVLKQDVGKR